MIRMIPRSDDLDDWWVNGTVHTGHCSTSHDELDDRDYHELRQERREAASRKRPCGFTAAWDEE